jgi:hypothetical protein
MLRLCLLLTVSLVAIGVGGCAGADEPDGERSAAKTETAGVAAATAGSGRTRILAVGDFGVGGDAQRATGTAMKKFERYHPSSLLVTLGDNDYTEDPAAFETNWQESFGWLDGADVRVAGSLGNHDVRVDGGRYQFDALGMPRSYYSTRVGKIHVFVLDSNDVDAEQTAWLERRLAATSAPWKIAVLHHPPYNCGDHTPAANVRAAWNPLFERYGVRLVVSGHDHNYQRFAARRGVTYVVHGGGGAGLYRLETCPAGHPRLAFGRSRHGFLSILATDRKLRVTALTRPRDVLDSVLIYP